MDVFQIRDRIIDDYAKYVRSFIQIYDERILETVEQELQNGFLWPDPLIQLNPGFEIGGWIDELVDSSILHESCKKIFRVAKDEDNRGRALQLYKHQVDAIHAAKTGNNYILTTGTGSGKSLAYIVPIVDKVLREGSGQGIKAIIIYPMNALANSQMGELEKFLCFGFPDKKPPVTFARYTGQESEEDREQIITNPPDILLTNYVMLELLLTRPRENKLIKAAKGLDFLVLDELHTYRGRQGADVGMLVRRLRNVSESDHLQCVGTSATLAGPGSLEEQQREVAKVGSKLFGSNVLPEMVISETLRPTTQNDYQDELKFIKSLQYRIQNPPNVFRSFQEFIHDPLNVWIEKTLGLDEDPESKRLVRCKPKPIHGESGTAIKLHEYTGQSLEQCTQAIQSALLEGYQCHHPETEAPAFAFKLHQFVSKGDTAYASAEPEDRRYITLSGQHYVPGSDKRKLLFPLAFCRECGQEYFSVWKVKDPDTGQTSFTARPVNERLSEEVEPGYLYIRQDYPWPSEADAIIDRVPEDWVEESKGKFKILKNRRKYLPQQICLLPDGQICSDPEHPEAVTLHYIPAPFRFCLRCCVSYDMRIRSDFGKLATLGTEGRSTATTILSLSSIQNLRLEESLPASAKKLLSFTDNRQDASLQAGHFNDFVEVGLLRSALYNAAKSASNGLEHDELAAKVFESLNLPIASFAQEVPEFQGGRKYNMIKQAFQNVLGYRLYHDLRRGWRIVAPNLEQCGLLQIEYLDLDQLCASNDLWDGHPALATATPQTREHVTKVLLDFVRRGLAIRVDYLDPDFQERIWQRSNQLLKWPWSIDEDERMTQASYLYPRSRRSGDYGGNLFLSSRAAFGQFLRKRTTFPDHEQQLSQQDTQAIILELCQILKKGGLLEEVMPPASDDDVPGYQIPASVLIWKAGDGTQAYHDPLRIPNLPEHGARTNVFFVDLYKHAANSSQELEAREHTAQVPGEYREDREKRFREANLPILFCSPTMELGVDIAQLNAVNLRNVPPTPANYAQRSGRAGRSGQPALIFTYCGMGNSHDQYFFNRPELMVSGEVSTPRLDLANEDLIKAHMHAIWLAETGQDLYSSLREIIDVSGQQPRLELLPQVRENIERRAPKQKVLARGQEILETIAEEVEPSDWYGEGWLEGVVNQAPHNLDLGCNRWRDLYWAALKQRDRQNSIISDATKTPKEREQARKLRREAETQLELLLQSRNNLYSDFYSYRYFASEGFLPGYNFPRLPLSAFIPGRRQRYGRDEFVSRPRFLAISEFGPGSFIYHEGSRYVIHKAIVSVGEDEEIATSKVKRCPRCGYVHPIHEGNGIDLCELCRSSLQAPINNLFRLQNVSTKRRDRINSDEEERLRFGYSLKTGFRFAEHGGRPSHKIAHIKDGSQRDLATLTYGHGATIWRINLGWARKKENSPDGFLLDIEQGYWVSENRLKEVEENFEESSMGRINRVIPYVEDHKNCLLFEPSVELSKAEMASLESALKTAVQAVFQLEEFELASEALPDKEDRQLILFYEASEGGAGILRRLIEDATALPEVARTALELCHFDPHSGKDQGRAQGAKEDCEAACYNCLMNFTNQPDHPLLDRKAISEFLGSLSGAQVKTSPKATPRSDHLEQLLKNTDSDLERQWLHFLEQKGFRLPSHAQKLIEKCQTRPDFFFEEYQVAVYIDGPMHAFPKRAERDQTQTECMEDYGFNVLRFRAKDHWESIIKKHPHIFGSHS